MRQLAAEIFVVAAIGLVLGLVGPFGSYAIPAAYRLIYWMMFTITGYLLFRPVTLAAQWLADGSAVPLWLCRIFAVAVASLPMTWVVGFAVNGMTIPAGINGTEFAIAYLQVAGIGAAIYTIMTFLRRNTRASASAEEVDDPRQITIDPPIAPPEQQAEPPALAKRLPPGFAPPILALTVEDHYVRVYNEAGSEMLLMRLSDAIAEMKPVQGMQVHRSWWVADSAVTGAISIGRNIRLELSNDLQVPVSRANISSVRARGWLENVAGESSEDV